MASYPKNYLAFIELFNKQKFFEAHEVLEEEWHKVGRHDDFYKGLIQMAAAFVHIQKRNVHGAQGLFRTSRQYLSSYMPQHQGLDLKRLLGEIQVIESSLYPENDLVGELISYPILELNP